jgi:photosystem II stability/assembly factor-like uncharacterized protein
VGSYGTIVKTTNGGTTWTAISTTITSNTLNSVYFPDDNTGYAVGDNKTILKTTNSGITWSTLESGMSGNSHDILSVYFINSNVGYVAGYNKNDDHAASFILKTINGGATWSSLSCGLYVEFESLYFTDASTGYAVGGDSHVPGGIILKTVNGGTTWTSQTSGTTNGLTSVYFTDATTGYAVGKNGTVLKTVNGGSTWSKLVSGTTSTLNSVYFTDANTGYAVGGNYLESTATILKTIDGGSTWTSLLNATDYNFCLSSVYFIDSDTGYAVGGGILKTIDGGATWTISSLTPGESVFFTNANTGYVVGIGGEILKTNSGLTTYSEQVKAPESKISIYPNPAKNKITITNQTATPGESIIDIFNIKGEQIMRQKFCNKNSMGMDISTLTKGVYFVRINNNSVIVTRKLVIK